MLAAWILVLAGSAAMAADAPAKPIRLGIIVSKFTATGPHWISNPYGYGNQLQRLRELKDPGIELIPVIEPGTDDDPALAAILQRSFAGKTPVNGYQPAELKKLDVVMGHMIFNMQGEMADALVAAVTDGLGLVQQSCGSVTPGYTEAINALAGMKNGEYGWNPRDVECEVIGTHPILGSLSGNFRAELDARPNGHIGQLTGIPLIRVKNHSDVYMPREKNVPEDFYPVYVSQLGKGRIVGIGLAHYVPTPPVLQQATKDRFFIRCVQWVAGRPVE